MNELVTGTADGVQLRVKFDWDKDRFRHRIELVPVEGDAINLLASMDEGEPEWPLSPPFQQLHIEPRPDRTVALLVGMAGKSHWSASIEAFHDSAKLFFDIAALVRREPIFLGCSYRYGEAVTSEANQLLTAGAKVQFDLCDATSDGTAWSSGEDGLQIVGKLPQEIPDSNLTVRWRYQLEAER